MDITSAVNETLNSMPTDLAAAQPVAETKTPELRKRRLTLHERLLAFQVRLLSIKARKAEFVIEPLSGEDKTKLSSAGESLLCQSGCDWKCTRAAEHIETFEPDPLYRRYLCTVCRDRENQKK